MPIDVKELTDLVDAADKATSGLENAELRRVAFERVLEHLLRNGAAGTPVTSRPDGASGKAPKANAEKADGVFAEEQQRIDAIATYFRITPDEVLHLFDTSEETPSLVLHSSSLDNTNTVATRQIALIVTGGRTALGQKTTTADIRSVVDNYGRLDSSNFMGTLANMPELAVLGKPRSPNRVVRMKATGAEQARELAQRMIGE